MPGPAPKPPEQRRRRTVPTTGEWIDIIRPRLDKPSQLPLSKLKFAKDIRWSAENRERWRMWCLDPVSEYWTEGDLSLAIETLRIYHEMAFVDLPFPEIARRMERLGLTPTGKRTLRFRIRFASTEEPNLPPISPDIQESGAASVVLIDERRAKLAHGA